uniref:Uncharacterized protein n=1 Tax=Trypanosoma congolense (strain IL3000) TaxID=1068625 RepID=G0UKR5_TRYCI|nr:hypothetical protein, unlikely [Trypanosoma congolense IL3000]
MSNIIDLHIPMHASAVQRLAEESSSSQSTFRCHSFRRNIRKCYMWWQPTQLSCRCKRCKWPTTAIHEPLKARLKLHVGLPMFANDTHIPKIRNNTTYRARQFNKNNV